MRMLTHRWRAVFSSLRSPINVELLKSEEGLQGLRESVRARFKSDQLVPQLQASYEAYRKHLFEIEQLNKQANDLKRTLKLLLKDKQEAQAQTHKQQLAALKEAQIAKEAQLKEARTSTEQLLLTVGNAVHPATVVSKDEANNRILRYYHPSWQGTRDADSLTTQQVQQQFAASPTNPDKVSYQDLTSAFRIADLTRGQKVSGHRGYFLCTNGVKLALGIAQYGLQFLESRGYELFETPALILEEVLRDSCQLNTITADMYRFTEDALCLIATSEQTLAGYHRGETLELRRLPVRMGGYSSCFRREAGAHGKDIHGLFRVHQFEKVEQFVVCAPRDSEAEMQRMVDTSEAFYQSLGIPYRVVDIVSGELNDPAIRKIDLEAYFPSQGKFRELVSVSNCTDYQSRLLETRMREGATTGYPHMLNGTLVAVQRAITCFLEHFYDHRADHLAIPAALQPFVRAQALHRPK